MCVKIALHLDTRKKIQETATELFMTYGIRTVTMDEIAKRLSVSKKTIYQEFKDKDELVSEVTKEMLEEDICVFHQLEGEAENILEHFYKVSKYMRTRFNKVNPSVLFDLERYHPKAYQLFKDFKEKHLKDTIRKTLEKGIELGYFRDDINPEILSVLRVDQMQLAFNISNFPMEKFNFGEVQGQIFDHFVHGILTDKGRKIYEQYIKQS